MTVRTVLSYVLEAVGVLLFALILFINFGWSWALLPIAVYVFVIGISVDRGRP